MLKKSLIFGTVALLLTALIAFTGCSQATDSDSSSSVTGGRNSVYGRVDVFELQEIINKAVEANEPIYLEDGLQILGANSATTDAWVEMIDFKGATIRFNGEVTANAKIHFNAARATVTFGAGGHLDTNNGDYIALDTANVSASVVDYGTGDLVRFGSLTDTQWTSDKIAVANFVYGSVPDTDYSTGQSVAPKSKSIKTIYVLDKVTIPSVVGTPDAINVLAFGTVDVTATSEYNLISQTFQANAVGALKLGTSSTITSSTGTATIYVPITSSVARLPNIKVENEKPIAITTASNSTTATPAAFQAYQVSGPGVLTLTNVNVGNVRVFEGDGNIVVSPTIAPVFTDVYIGGAVNAVFPQKLTLTDPTANAYSLIGGNVQFRAGVTSKHHLNFGGDVTLYNDTDGSHYSIEVDIAGQQITLAKGKSIIIGGGSFLSAKTPQDVVPPVKVLSAEEDKATVLRVGAATLTISSATAPNVSGKDAPDKMAAAYRVTIGGKAFIRSGGLLVNTNTSLALPVSAELTTTAINNDPRIDGGLALADGALLALAVSDANPGTLFIGVNKITGLVAATGNASVLTATGGTITLKGDVISGPAQAKLTVSSTAAKFDVLGDLALNAVTLDVNARGDVALASGGKTVKLTNGAGLVFAADAGTTDTRRIIAVSTARADISGGAAVNVSTNKLVSITQSGATDAVIKSRTTAITLSRTGTNLAAQ
jgi:hypothetical protein